MTQFCLNEWIFIVPIKFWTYQPEAIHDLMARIHSCAVCIIKLKWLALRDLYYRVSFAYLLDSC